MKVTFILPAYLTLS